MTTNQTKENLNETFIVGLSGILKITGFKKLFLKTWISKLPIFLSIAGLIACWVLKIKAYSLILEVKAQMISFLPGILGFTIAGYSLMVGFIQGGMLNSITEPMKDSKFSLYQSMSATFASNVIFQAIALVIAYTIHFIIFFDESSNASSSYPEILIFILNNIALLVLLYWFCLSLLLVIQIVLNIFSFSQLHHYFINKAKVNIGESEEIIN